jgi:hypothetical protein
MRLAALAALAGCSFAGVRAPTAKIDPTTLVPSSIQCNDSSLLPSLDALGGAAAIATAGGGVILERTTVKERYDNFTLYYAGPLLALAIVYWWSASFGNDRISKCSDLKERANATRPVVRPIEDEPGAKKSMPDDKDIEIH